ncbi:phage tail fiber protein [Devosia sp. 66-22]|uniref:phage tail fiber domain-containing protein n=1 Tax=Devosia sp. 66-22 TaxID=1895753 RepID=UPI00092AEF5D|nr:phage tail fiber protein [Devosia sp. 66-22]OJX53637.1 MAG: hypothetical protein BGO81_13805 [Devosia sp. 66-22]
MALSFAHYPGNGATTNFNVPFEYLSKSHVKVLVDGTPATFSWVSTYTVQITPAPPTGTVVEVRRETPSGARLVNFHDGSTMVESDLNTDSLQAFFLVQEAFDQQGSGIALGVDGDFDAEGRRIRNLNTPELDTDAATKGFVEFTLGEHVAAIEAAIEAANNAAYGLQAERLLAQQARVGAEAAALIAQTAASDFTEQLTQGAAYRDASQAAAATATAAKNTAQTKATEASTSATSASGSATSAASSAVTAHDERMAAEGFATDAQNAASTADGYVTMANNAKNDANLAMAGAEAARDEAFTFRDDTQAARDAALAAVAPFTSPLSDTANPHGVTKAQVGLGNADNTSDLGKPISTATQAALDAKASSSSLSSHVANTSNPHGVTKAQVGLANVDNTSDLGKPISTATQTALNGKQAAAGSTGSGNFVRDSGPTITHPKVSGVLSAGTFSGTGATLGTNLSAGTVASSTNTTGTHFHMSFWNPNGVVANVNSSGFGCQFVNVSDREKKVDDGLVSHEVMTGILRLIEIHNFRWKRLASPSRPEDIGLPDTPDIGVFAQDLYQVYPDAVTPGGWVERERWDEKLDPDTGEVVYTVDEEGNSAPVIELLQYLEYVPWGVNYTKLIPVLVAASQALLVRQEALEARVVALEAVA